MNDRARSEAPLNEKPLFVLTYRRYKVWIRTVVFSFGALVMLLFVVAMAATYKSVLDLILGELIFGGLFLLVCFCILDWQSLGEIHLYEDRIVRFSKFRRQVEVPLANAQVNVVRFTGIIGGIGFVANDGNRVSRRCLRKSVSYDVYLADDADIRELHRLLADLSGRSAGEFERSGFSRIDKFFREGEP